MELYCSADGISALNDLRRLSFVEVNSISPLSLFLNHTTLPRLCALSLALQGPLEPCATSGLADSLKSLGPSLEYLSLRDPFTDVLGPLFEVVWASLTALKWLSLHHSCSGAGQVALVQALLEAPSQIEQLRLISVLDFVAVNDTSCAEPVVEEDLSALLASTRAIDGLNSVRRFCMPRLDALCNKCAGAPESKNLMNRVEQLAAQMDIVLEEEDPQPADFEDWETFLDEW